MHPGGHGQLLITGAVFFASLALISYRKYLDNLDFIIIIIVCMHACS